MVAAPKRLKGEKLAPGAKPTPPALRLAVRYGTVRYVHTVQDDAIYYSMVRAADCDRGNA